MKKFFVAGIGFALLLASAGVDAQVITIGGSVLGRPLAITGRTTVSFSQLPPNVQQVIQSQAAGGVVAYVQQGNYRGRAYSVTYQRYGGVQTRQFTENGSELSGYGGLIVSPASNMETISLQQLPPAVQQSVAALAAGGDITFATRGIYNIPVFDALVQPPGASSQHVVVTASGGLLQGATGATVTEAAVANAAAANVAANEAAGANLPVAPLNSNAAQAAATPVGPVAGTLSFQDLSGPVQQSMLNRSSNANFGAIQQLAMPDGTVGYRGIYMRNGQQYQVTVAQNGIVISEGLLGP